MRKRSPDTLFERYLPYLLSGLLLGLSYPSYPYVRLEVLAWVWMVPLLLALKEVRSFRSFLGRVYLATLVVSIFGEAWLLVSHPWGTILLFFVNAVVFTVPFVAFYCIRQALSWRVALWSAPVVWSAWDWVYHQSEGSLGWIGLWGSQANLYWLVQYADLTGVWGITFWLVLFNVLVVMVIEDWQARSHDFSRSSGTATKVAPTRFLARRLAMVSAAMLVFPLAYSASVFIKAASKRGPEISVLLVQPNINPWQKSDRKTRPTSLGKTTALTSTAIARHKPDLIIWPEGAVPYVLPQEPAAREFVYRAVSKWQVPLLTGTLDQRTSDNPAERPPLLSYEGRDSELFNAAVLLAPEQYRDRQGAEEKKAGQRFSVKSSEVYHKQVLMPFVEHVPWSERFPVLSHLALDLGVSSGISAGRQATVFAFRTPPGAEVRVAAPICYEQLYPATLAEFVRQGADLLAVITNEGWWSKTHGAYQLAAFTRLRAIETRRSIARCANTGLTCFIDPLGRIYDQAPWWEEQTVVGQVRLAQGLSWYVRYPDYFPKACVWLSLGLAVAVAVQKVRQALPWRKPHLGEARAWVRRA